MSYEWGRAPEAGKWQHAVPVWFMGVIVIAVAGGIAVWLIRQTFVWTPLRENIGRPSWCRVTRSQAPTGNGPNVTRQAS